MVMVYIVMAHIAMAYIVMAYIVMACTALRDRRVLVNRKLFAALHGYAYVHAYVHECVRVLASRRAWVRGDVVAYADEFLYRVSSCKWNIVMACIVMALCRVSSANLNVGIINRCFEAFMWLL